MAAAGLREELSCPLCWEIYTDPVTLPCGHNYCLRCIGRHWERQRDIEEDLFCPVCIRRYGKQPELNRNLTLCNVAELFLPTDPQHGDIWIPCTYCAPPVPAAKSCLLCEASLCATHVQEHSRAAEHVLTVPTALFGDRKCSAHGELLRYRCTEDGARVCVSCCLAGGHRGHRVELLNEDNIEKYILEMVAARLGSELTCPLCEDIYKFPVTLPCGHNFCLRCIGGRWHWQEGIRVESSCPECRETYRRRPELNRNLHDIVKSFLPALIPCTYCAPPVPAAQSCLTCEASLCARHVSEHGRSHKLIDSITLFRDNVCSTHQKPLGYYCRGEEACLCEDCVPEHGGHRVEKLDEKTVQTLKRMQESKEKQRFLEVMHHWDLRDKLSCPLCREIYTDPVTLPCGHNYCLRCIGGTGGERREKGGTPSCPVCGWGYEIRPELRKNETLCNIVEPFHLYTKPRAPPVPAVKRGSYLTCPLCQLIYTDPVTLPCSHNYCLRCIVRTWEEQRKKSESPSCPECEERYWIHPEYIRNPSLGNIAQKVTLRNTFLVVFCTYCIHSAEPSAVPATKSCLHCATSLCERHVTEHSQSAEHVLTDPTRRCSAHQELLRYRCTKDGARVCVSCCLAGEHRGHGVELLNEASEIRNIQAKLSCSICRKVYTDPVTLPCGHNYCLRCIGGTGGERGQKVASLSCPKCGESTREMELSKNLTLCHIVQLLPTPPEQPDPAEPPASFGHRNCSAHGERLRYRCTEDGAPVCVSCCLAGGHRGHRVEMFPKGQE
uniref:Uncharacterized LOC100491025 n=1 Tax=Xenopus tropicalis TaxID=8364 RepID=A0A6I8QCB7_XENTR